MIKKPHRRVSGFPALLLLTLLALLPCRAGAAEGSTFSYTYEGQTVKYYVISEADPRVGVDENPGLSGALILPEKVKADGKEYKVTVIGSYAFKECTGLTSVVLPNTLTAIGKLAFNSCTNLTSVNIPDAVTKISNNTFGNCRSLTSIKLPDGVTEIGSAAFYDCSSLTSINIPDRVTTIGINAFKNCSSLTSINIPASVTEIGKSAFAGCSSLTSVYFHDPEKITFNEYSFSNCVSLASVILPISSIVYKTAFAGCTGLKKSAYSNKYDLSNPFPSGIVIKYPMNSLIENGVIWSGDKSTVYFVTIDAEGELTLPESVTKVGSNAFAFCDKLTSVKALPTIVPEMDATSFDGLYATCKLSVPESAVWDYLNDYSWNLFEDINGSTLTGNGNFVYRVYPSTGTAILSKPAKRMTEATILSKVSIDGTMYKVNAIGAGAFKNETLAKVTIRNGIEKIGKHAFEGTELTEVTLPESINSIGDYAFADISELTRTNIPAAVKTIGSHGFENTSLTQIVIPEAVEFVGDSAFRNTKLTSATIGTGVKTIGDCAFGLTQLKSIILPANLESIGSKAFYGCTFKELVIPASVKSIGSDAFELDWYVEVGKKPNLIISEGTNPLKLGAKAFSYPKKIYIGRNFTCDESAISIAREGSVIIGNSVTELPSSAFSGKSNLLSLTLGSGLSVIPARIFSNSKLTEVVIPSNVTTIGESAFSNCKLTKVIIGCGTTKIEANAFANNMDIATIDVTAVNPPEATDDVFTTQNARLNVLKESREAYENAQCWYQFEGVDLVPITTFKILNEPAPNRIPAYANGTNAPKQIQFSVSVEPADASLKDYIFWSSSNPEVATVDNNGLVTFTGKAEGTSEITAHTLYADVAATMTVNANGDIEGGVEDIFSDNTIGTDRPNDIYNLQGVLLKRDASQDDIDALAPGLYIIGARKVVVK